MMRNLTYIFSTLFLTFLGGICIAQSNNDSQTIDPLSTSEGKRSYLGVSIDYGKILTLPLKSENKVEGGIDFTINDKIKFLGELGWASLTPQSAIENGEYESTGIYYRAGLAYGGEILPKSFLFIGFMYAASQFEDSGRIIVESEVYDDFDETFSRTDLSASWFEIIMVTEQEFRKNMFLGAKFRVRIQYDFPKAPESEPDIYSIPGYGRAADNSIPSFNLYYKYIFPF